MFLAFPRPQNILGTIIISETPADFAVIVVHSAFTKLCSQKFQNAPITTHPITTRCVADFHAHTYYHALLILLYNSFVNSRRPRVSTSASALVTYFTMFDQVYYRTTGNFRE